MNKYQATTPSGLTTATKQILTCTVYVVFVCFCVISSIATDIQGEGQHNHNIVGQRWTHNNCPTGKVADTTTNSTSRPLPLNCAISAMRSLARAFTSRASPLSARWNSSIMIVIGTSAFESPSIQVFHWFEITGTVVRWTTPAWKSDKDRNRSPSCAKMEPFQWAVLASYCTPGYLACILPLVGLPFGHFDLWPLPAWSIESQIYRFGSEKVPPFLLTSCWSMKVRISKKNKKRTESTLCIKKIWNSTSLHQSIPTSHQRNMWGDVWLTIGRSWFIS